MFEHDQKTLSTLMAESNEFKALYDKHKELDDKVDKAEGGYLGMGEDALTSLKKERLLTMDRMSLIIRDYQQQAAG